MNSALSALFPSFGCTDALTYGALLMTYGHWHYAPSIRVKMLYQSCPFICSFYFGGGGNLLNGTQQIWMRSGIFIAILNNPDMINVKSQGCSSGDISATQMVLSGLQGQTWQYLGMSMDVSNDSLKPCCARK